MQGLTHSQVTHIIKRHMSKQDIRIAELSKLSGIPYATLALVLEGHSPLTAPLMAALGLALNQDFSQLWGQHSIVIYRLAHFEAQRAPTPPEAKRGEARQFRQVVEQIARQALASGDTTELLLDEICGLTSVPRAMAETELALVVRGIKPPKGDYGFEQRTNSTE